MDDEADEVRAVNEISFEAVKFWAGLESLLASVFFGSLLHTLFGCFSLIRRTLNTGPCFFGPLLPTLFGRVFRTPFEAKIVKSVTYPTRSDSVLRVV